MRDPYEVLGLPRSCTQEEIKAAFRKLAGVHHPDKNPGDETASQRFKELNTAYQLLSDPNKRAMFDRFGHGAAGGIPGNPFGGGNPFAGGVPFDFSSFVEQFPAEGILGDLLGKLGFKGGDRGDIKKEIVITLEEACFGAQKELTYDRLEGCKTCAGSGAKEGSKVHACPQCQGRGRVKIQQGLIPLAVERECSQCHGRGKVVDDPCATCRGAGLVAKGRTIEVTIPGGIDDGATRLVDRAGSTPRPDRGPGDLELTFRIKPHPFFRRSGEDVIGHVPITFVQACLGGEVEVPTLDGRGRLRVPPGTQPNAVLRIRGKGMPKRVTGGRGDQLVEVRLEVPSELSPRARELIESLAGELGENMQPQQKSFLEKLKELFG